MNPSEANRAPTSRAMGWAVLTLASSRIITFVATLFLARLLVPADFGVFAVGLLVINYLDRVKDMGVGAGLIYRREPWDQVGRTGLPLVIASSGVLAALAFTLAPFAAEFFDDPRIVGVLRGLALVLFINGVAGVPDAKLRRDMDFRRRLVPELAAAILKNGVSVGLAVAGAGVFSLVWGQLVGTIAQAVLYWALCGWRPGLGWDRQMARALIRYGLPTSLVALLSVFIENIDYLVIGHRLSPAQLGYYSMAYRLPELTIFAVCITTSQVLFPAFSRLQHDLPRLREAYLQAARYVVMFTLPVGASMMVLAPEVVLTLFTSQWEASIPVLRLIAAFAAISSMSFHAGELYKATGRPGILNTLAIGDIALLFPALWIAAGHSIVAVSWIMCVGAVGLTSVRLIIVTHIIRIKVRDLAGAFVPGLVAAAGVALLDLAAAQGLGVLELGLSPALELIALAAITIAGYLALLRWVAPDVVRYGLALVRSRLNRA